LEFAALILNAEMQKFEEVRNRMEKTKQNMTRGFLKAIILHNDPFSYSFLNKRFKIILDPSYASKKEF
jgi:hypothetical protein